MELHSGDPEWVVVQRGDTFTLLDNLNQAHGDLELPHRAPGATMLFCNGSIVVAQTIDDQTTISALSIPGLAVAAQLPLPGTWSMCCVTGQRVALLAANGQRVALIRVASKALSLIEFELGAPAEFVLPLEKQQILIGTGKKLEAYDALTGRPTMRVNVALPPAPRTLGTAQGHLWITRPGSDSLLIVRLSDGRTFPHVVGAEPLHSYSDLRSPYLVIQTAQGLCRLHCFAHSLVAIGTPAADAYTLQPNGDETVLVGMADNDATPWRASLATNNIMSVAPSPSMGGAALGPATTHVGSAAVAPTRPFVSSAWRSKLATFEAANDTATLRTLVAPDSGLARWCASAGFGDQALQTVAYLYARYLRGALPLPAAELAHWLGDHDAAWQESLGHGELATHGLIEHSTAGVALRFIAGRFFDDAPLSLSIRRGTRCRTAPTGHWWQCATSNPAADLDGLVADLGAIAVVGDPTTAALVEAHLHGLPAIVSGDATTIGLAVANAPRNACIIVLSATQPWFVPAIFPRA